MRVSLVAADGEAFLLILEIVRVDARVLAAQVLRDDCDVHLLGQVLQDFGLFRASHRELTDGALGQERLDDSPDEGGKHGDVDCNQLVLPFRAVLEAVAHVPLGDGQFEVITAEACHVGDDGVLVGVACELALQPDLEVVDVVEAVLLYILDFVYFQVRSPIQHHCPSLKVISQEGEELHRVKLTSSLWMCANIFKE